MNEFLSLTCQILESYRLRTSHLKAQQRRLVRAHTTPSAQRRARAPTSAHSSAHCLRHRIGRTEEIVIHEHGAARQGGLSCEARCAAVTGPRHPAWHHHSCSPGGSGRRARAPRVRLKALSSRPQVTSFGRGRSAGSCLTVRCSSITKPPSIPARGGASRRRW